jgi:hypothetical protein
MLSLLLADDGKTTTLRYVRPGGGGWVAESEITVTRSDAGTRYVSKTTRPRETMTLTVLRDPKGQLREATLVQEAGEARSTASLSVREGKVLLSRDGGVSEIPGAKPDAIATTAPDWTDILDMVARYDAEKGGKQEFAGVWFHPKQPTLTPTFSIEKVGTATIQVSGKEQTLTRYQARLRGGSAYAVWALPDRRVCKILAAGGKGAPVVLQGYEEPTRELKD